LAGKNGGEIGHFLKHSLGSFRPLPREVIAWETHKASQGCMVLVG